MTDKDRKAALSDDELKRKLTQEQYNIAFCAATERPFTSLFNDEKRAGVYRCVACDAVLWSSEDKFNSGTGWPSFTKPAAEAVVGIRYGPDRSPLRQLRRAYGARFSRRSRPYRFALLHQWRRLEVRPEIKRLEASRLYSSLPGRPFGRSHFFRLRNDEFQYRFDSSTHQRTAHA